MPTDDRIRELARQAETQVLQTMFRSDLRFGQFVEHAIRTALAEQREEDARIAENVMGSPFDSNTSRRCAAAIRGNASAESEDARDAARGKHVAE